MRLMRAHWPYAIPPPFCTSCRSWPPSSPPLVEATFLAALEEGHSYIFLPSAVFLPKIPSSPHSLKTFFSRQVVHCQCKTRWLDAVNMILSLPALLGSKHPQIFNQLVNKTYSRPSLGPNFISFLSKNLYQHPLNFGASCCSVHNENLRWPPIPGECSLPQRLRFFADPPTSSGFIVIKLPPKAAQIR